MATPVRYTPDVEVREDGEEQVTAEIIETMRSIQDTTFADCGHGIRSVHAKSHALLEGELTVLGNLPPELAQGLFATPRSYPVVLRLSTTPGDILPDSVSSPRGMALKVIGVDGERLPGSESDVTQDFVMVNGPAFNAPGTKQFLGNLKLLEKTTDKAEGLKVALSVTLRGIEQVVEALGGESAKLKSLGGHPATNPLGDAYFTQVPIRYGDNIAKISVAPIAPALTALKDERVAVAGRHDALREEMLDFFRREGGEWEVRVQLCTDLETMPIEDASVEWPEDESPYVAVARIVVKPQSAWSDARAKVGDDELAFSPWHGLAAHQPLGGVMRARKPAYEQLSGLRRERNGCPIHEPRAAPGLAA